MKIKMIRSTNDTQYGFLHFNDIVEVKDDEKIQRWIKRGIAVEIAEEAKKPKKEKEEKKEKAVEIVEVEKEEVIEEEKEEAFVPEDIDLEALRELAKELAIPYYKQMKPETLKARVEEAKAGVAKLNRRTVN
jgi:uncharacterized protein YdiU (UPF0061 family)